MNVAARDERGRRDVWRTVAGGALGALLGGLCGCATVVPIEAVTDIAGRWHGRVSSPAGNARAAMTVAESGEYAGTMALNQAERRFHGALIAVRPGEVRYQGTDGNGRARLYRDDGRVLLKFLRDDGGVDAVFSRDP